MKGFFKVVLGTIVGLILFIVLQFVLFIGIAASFSSSEVTKLESNSVYRLDMKGILAERVANDPLAEMFSSVPGYEQETKIGLEDILSNIKLAKEDAKIQGIYLKGGSLQTGFASAKQIRDALLDFKQSGKWIVAYADDYSQLNYYIASVADRVCLNQQGSVALHGLASSLMFYKNTLDKLGIEMQVFKVGTFKSAVEPFITTQMSEPNRLQYQTLLDDFWSEMVKEIGESRDLSVMRLNELADENMDLAPQERYVETKLVDTLLYVQDMDSLVKRLCRTDKYHFVSHKSMCQVVRNEKYESDKIAVLYAEGDITDDTGDGIVGTKMVKTINELVKDDDVKAIVMRVNSGGGSAYASEQIWHAFMVAKEAGKPIVVSMGDYAASGGYYISCMADTIFAEPTTLTGSIGIFGLIPNFRQTADKIGLSFDGVQTNKYGLFYADAQYGTMSEEEKLQMQNAINRGYELFTQRCADGRHCTQDSIKAIAEGRVWSGTRALELGLVDKLGSLNDAIECAARMASLDKYRVATYPEVEDLYTQILNSTATEKIANRIIANRLGFGYRQYETINKVLNTSGIRAQMVPVEIY